jgi:hypothetical protein
MKIHVNVLALAIFLSSSAFAGSSKQQATQDSTDRLNAPTADGSPTLQVTSDWLAKTLQDYGGDLPNNDYDDFYINVGIDNNCRLSYADKSVEKDNGAYEIRETTVILGAVDSVNVDAMDLNDNHNVIGMTTGKVAAVSETDHPQTTVKGKALASPTPPLTSNKIYGIFIERTPPPRPGADIPETNAQMVPRIVAALQHAVSLCQGTYTPPAQAKQPF